MNQIQSEINEKIFFTITSVLHSKLSLWMLSQDTFYSVSLDEKENFVRLDKVYISSETQRDAKVLKTDGYIFLL